MGYKPTLGGLKKAQEFLKLKGHHMPIFQMHIYSDGRFDGRRWMPGKGRTISIDDAILQYGVMCEVVDVRLTNKHGYKYIMFSAKIRVGLVGMSDFMRDWGSDVVIEFHPNDPEIQDFMDSDGGSFFNIARWGKAEPTMRDRIKFRFFPTRYANEVFG